MQHLSNLPVRRFTVYAIRLHGEVLQSKKFRDANPLYLAGSDCYYIGMTAKDPKIRFEQHKTGYKSNRYARKYGVELMPPSFTVIRPRTYEEACGMERRIAARLRKKGFGIWQN